MNGKDMFLGLNHISAKYIEEAETVTQLKSGKKLLSMRRSLLIAAIIVLTVLLVGCAVVYAMRLQDIVIRQDTYPSAESVLTSGERTQISLQGYIGSPGYQANKEWFEFCETYQYPENEPEIPMEQRLDYLAYGCFYPEEIAKVDEICEKYGLNKLGHAWIEENVDITFEALGIDGLVLPDAAAEVEYMWNQAYYYRDGTFDIGFTLKSAGDIPAWNGALDLRMRYVQKTSFDGVYGQMDPIESYEQWQYTTNQGMEVLLARNENHAMMIADRKDAFLTVNIQNADVYGEQDTSLPGRLVLEAIAEMLDLRVTPGPVDVVAAQERYDATLKRLEEERLARKEQNRSFTGFIRKRIEEWWGTSQGKICAFADIDGNGTDEMLLGNESHFFGVYMMREDGVVSVPGLWDDGTGRTVYLCENGIILVCKEAETAKAHTFYLYENDQAEEIITIAHFYGPGEESPYRRYWLNAAGEIQWEAISQEKYESIVSEHTVMEIMPMWVDDYLSQEEINNDN